MSVDNQEPIRNPEDEEEFEFSDEEKMFMNRISEKQKKIYEDLIDLLNKDEDTLWENEEAVNDALYEYEERRNEDGFVEDDNRFDYLYNELIMVEDDLFGTDDTGTTTTTDTEGGRRRPKKNKTKKSKKTKKNTKKRKTIRKSKKSKKSRRSTKRN